MSTSILNDSDDHFEHATTTPDSAQGAALVDAAARPYSIDLSLQLERSLELESDSDRRSSASASHPQSRPQSLDPGVLASIVTQLRSSLEDLTRERDTLSAALAEARVHSAQLEDELGDTRERCVGLEDELRAAREKNKEDEDAIVMLRSKVEESRRGLMRLQTENRRKSLMSNASIDLSSSSAAQPGQQTPTSWGSPASKRASFAPLTGSPAGRTGHRRISSVSDSALNGGPWPASPGSGISSSDADVPTPLLPPPLPNRRISLLSRTEGEDVEMLRRELVVVREQLEETRGELTEASEAHEASELCVKALRTFIADNSVGMAAASTGGSGARPSVDGTPKGATGKWGFGFWKVDTAGASAGASAGGGDTPSSSSSSVRASPAGTTPTGTGGSSAAGVAPFSKFGSLFGSRASNTSSTAPQVSQPVSSVRQGTGQHMVHQEPMCNGSDTSSVAESTAEPVSPVSEVTPRDRHALMYPEDAKETYEEVVMGDSEDGGGAVAL